MSQLTTTPQRAAESPVLADAILAPLDGAGFSRRMVAYLGYLLANVLLVAGILLTCNDRESIRSYYAEGCLIEDLQVAHIGLAGFVYLTAALLAFHQRLVERWAYSVIALGAFWALNRELDGVWEAYELDHIYDRLKLIIGVPALVIGVCAFSSCWRSWIRAPFQGQFVLLYVALGGYLAAQLIATSLRPLDINYTLRRAVQESIELLAGTFFVYSAIELFWRTRRGGESNAS